MSSRQIIASTLFSAAVLVGLGGCAAQHHDEANCKVVKPGEVKSVNKMCVVMNEDPVDPAMGTVSFKGQEVGFCCSGCVKKWNKMNDDEKQAAINKAVALNK